MSKYMHINRDRLVSKYMQWAAERLQKGENPSDYTAFKQYDLDTGGSGTTSELKDKGWIGNIETGISLLFPVSRMWDCVVTQRFGPSTDPGLQAFYESLGYAGHNGLDIASTNPAYQYSGIIPVVACDDGKAVCTYDDPQAGDFVAIDHVHGRSRVLHLQTTVIYNGFVRRGDLLGYMGMTGAATGVHVHWDYKPNNADENNGYKGRIDPLSMNIVYQ